MRVPGRRSHRILAAALGAGLALALAGLGCGGGGGGGGGTPPTQPPGSITFNGSSVAAPAVRLVRGAGSGSTVLELEVRGDQLASTYGIAFDLTFPSNLLRFDAFAEDGFLSQGGAQTSLQVAQPTPGRLVVGHTRLGDVGAVSGSGTFMRLRFVAVGTGSGSFSFSANRVFDAAGRQVGGTAWGGGTVQVAM
ncbi:MAG TPA: cohesin domain-containing protein [Thermoanaerobaculia bacterium]|nr:cohesin domain-containing protein [Thermoanaerobaculia bacterium]